MWVAPTAPSPAKHPGAGSPLPAGPSPGRCRGVTPREAELKIDGAALGPHSHLLITAAEISAPLAASDPQGWGRSQAAGGDQGDMEHVGDGRRGGMCGGTRGRDEGGWRRGMQTGLRGGQTEGTRGGWREDRYGGGWRGQVQGGGLKGAAGGAEGKESRGTDAKVTEGDQGDGCKGDGALTGRHAAAVRAQEHLRLREKSGVSKSAWLGDTGPQSQVQRDNGSSFPAMLLSRHGQVGGRLFRAPFGPKIGSSGPLLPRHHLPGSRQPRAPSGCGQGFPMPGDTW